ncbi:IS30 family transposase [Simplicispira suum]|jgi:IS30 family transposase|uniref:IS30 family transposase n=1 Tax=Simplicispira suum TaxID=2109915 RepID=A0A2S0N572_9BURK|nr:IS30 family transposase [Simplicispira suum]AVO42360.1 IS30 family transposase [Simplicispira suum]AVO43292.1 IS30 family transposase [Simplicispira suum]
MARLGRPGLSDAQRRELWERWKAGDSISDIGRALFKHPGSVHGVLALGGGIYSPARKRAASALTTHEREQISRGLAAGHSCRQIAAELGRSPSTVSREIHRNGGAERYRAALADGRAWEQARRPQPCALALNPELARLVSQKLALQWSPQQIAGWLRREHPDTERMQVSHETIYRSLFVQARGVLKKELMAHLRTRRSMRRTRAGLGKASPRGQIPDAVSILDRPAQIEDRAVPGHWEGDLVTGAKNSHIATLVERHSRFALLVQVDGKDTASVVQALTREVKRLPEGSMKSLTWDRGMELAQHRMFSMATEVDVFFCDPRSPWQRGTNENTNGLVRQYLPKGADLSVYSQADLDAISMRLNTRPRKTLDYETPASRLQRAVAATG